MVAFETKHGFEGIVLGTNICRKCACGQPTRRLSEFQCGKCGGDRQVFEQCYVPIALALALRARSARERGPAPPRRTLS